MVIRKGVIIAGVSEEELTEALEIAKVRNDKGGDGAIFEDDYTGIEIHQWGALAELVWSRLTGWPMDKEKRSGGDGGIDFTSGETTYQVKTRNTARYNKPDLLCRTEQAKADRFILSEIDANNLTFVRFVGWCTRKELMEEKKDIPGKGERYIRNRDKLRRIPMKIIVNP